MRPRFHFTGAGWINDPHGITVHRGRYHAFYQFVPGQTAWDLGCRWGHAVGPDMLSLVELPPVLAPGDGEDGIWTGSLVVDDDGAARIFYTAVDAPDLDHGRVRVATPLDDGWVDWKKGAVVAHAPEGLALRIFRDPAVRRDPDAWRMVLGGMAGGDGVALSYRSDDLERWEYEGVAVARSSAETVPVWTGEGWECPQVVDVDGGHAMVFSAWQPDRLHHAAYGIGAWADGRFDATTWGRLSYGPSPYAPSCYLDAAGRLSIVFWLRDVAGDGWSGAHSIPYLLTRDGDRLVLTMHPELEAYATDDGEPSRALVAEAVDGATVTVSTPAGVVLASVEPKSDEIVVRVGDGEWRMPRGGDVRVIVDGPVLEVVAAAGLFAAPLPDDGGERVMEGATRVRRLERGTPV